MKIHHLTPIVLFAACCLAPAAERVALVIGNNAYQHGTPLRNPINDARAVAGALKEAGFEVSLAEDAGLEVMEKKVADFSRAAKGAKAAWFYYSGHGAEVKRSNYLIPVDAAVTEEFQVKHKTLALDLVLAAMDEAGTPLKVVVLDCCRDNPFGKGWTRSGAKGLAQLGETPEGTIIAFATAPGKTAADGSGANSPYTTALVQAMKMPGLEIDQVFKIAGKNVITATGKQQQPWVNSSFFDSFLVLNRPANRPAVPLPAPGPAAATREKPFENSLGMRFVPAVVYGQDKQVLFSIWETRRQDYEAYAAEASGVDGTWKNATYEGQPVGHEPRHPVVCVSHADAVAFCQWLTKRERAADKIPPGAEYRLPTDVEWSLAVGIGEREDASATPKDKNYKIKDVYPWNGGKGSWPPPDRVGNYCGQETKGKFGNMIDGYDDGFATTAPVGSYPANANGLFDLGGNVWEWCGDSYDGSGGSSSARVLRGGSWYLSGSVLLLSSYRDTYTPGYRGNRNGFRVVLVLSAR